MVSFSRAHKIPHMHVHWLSPYTYEDPQQVYQSPLASLRLRAGPLVSVADSHMTVSIGEKIPRQADVCIVGKIGAHDIEQRKTEWLKAIFKLDCPVVLDYTDDHIQHPSVMTDFYQVALERANLAICSSNYLKDSLARVFDKLIGVIPDAIEYTALQPRTEIHTPRRLLWFGHASNIPSLLSFLETFDPPIPVEVLVLTSEEGLQVLKKRPNLSKDSVRLLYKPWSIEEMPKAAQLCDACIIPGHASTKLGVSSNRLLTALMLGLPTGSELLSSYVEFKDFFAPIQGDAFTEMLIRPPEWHQQVIKAQNHILHNYAFASLGAKWQIQLQDIHSH